MVLTKRGKFVLTSLILSVGFLALNSLDNQLRFWGIGLLSLVTLVLFSWSLREGIGRNATLLVLILPTLFTLGVGLFWFLLPSTVFARLPVVVMYGIGIYALSLTMNIFTVSTIRTIALARAAKGVGFVLTLFTLFLLCDAILSLKAPVYITALVVFIFATPLFLQGLWASRLGSDIPGSILIFSLVFSYFLATVSLFLYFWPVSVVIGSLFLTVASYVLLGLGQAKQEGRLFRQTVRDYLVVGIMVFIAMLSVTSWRG